MVKREEVSVVFQGTKAGGKVERLFGRDGLDDTAIDTCELYVQENGNSVNRTIITPACEDMGRSSSAAQFHRSHRRQGRAAEHARAGAAPDADHRRDLSVRCIRQTRLHLNLLSTINLNLES